MRARGKRIIALIRGKRKRIVTLFLCLLAALTMVGVGTGPGNAAAGLQWIANTGDTVPVMPGVGIGPLAIGMTIPDAVHIMTELWGKIDFDKDGSNYCTKDQGVCVSDEYPDENAPDATYKTPGKVAWIFWGLPATVYLSESRVKIGDHVSPSDIFPSIGEPDDGAPAEGLLYLFWYKYGFGIALSPGNILVGVSVWAVPVQSQ